jgi:hypothetical protein
MLRRQDAGQRLRILQHRLDLGQDGRGVAVKRRQFQIAALRAVVDFREDDGAGRVVERDQVEAGGSFEHLPTAEVGLNIRRVAVDHEVVRIVPVGPVAQFAAQLAHLAQDRLGGAGAVLQRPAALQLVKRRSDAPLHQGKNQQQDAHIAHHDEEDGSGFFVHAVFSRRTPVYLHVDRDECSRCRAPLASAGH